MDINERILKITGSSSLEGDLKLGEYVKVNLDGFVVKIEEKDNQDGTKDRIFFVKQSIAIVRDEKSEAKE